ncbi:hypothetical protein A5699_07230 [Mycobacterium sp. E802]|uniref:DUF3060 domain-containing protein n=1 Tax=Mycobacterium sp. E802 TaxID=1834152 RepID=UPI00080058FB|nr:DUF3060 domain-containing protein [Mycobacterium sp. E802]OBG82079.1 hypothetical protein A5699_07230 [Mycobacterium sp. E802]
MDSKDDPEARIRELERPLAETARTSELGTHGSGSFPPPPPGPPAPWPGYEPYPPYPAPPQRKSNAAPFVILFALLSSLLVAGAIAAFVFFDNAGEKSGSADSFSDSQSTAIRAPASEPLAPSQVSPGQTVIVSGIGEHRTVECQDSTVIVSGVENQLQITGHCIAVTVSGVNNVIEVESADTIGVSGFENRVTYRSGQPEVSKSGQSNVVEPG